MKYHVSVDCPESYIFPRDYIFPKCAALRENIVPRENITILAPPTRDISSVLVDICYIKGRSHYSDNQSPTSNNHYFWGGCRRLSEVGKCLSMIGDWLSENYIDNLSPTSDNHPFSGWFSMVGKWLLMIAEQFWSARGFRCSINNHRQPNKAAIQNEYLILKNADDGEIEEE